MSEQIFRITPVDYCMDAQGQCQIEHAYYKSYSGVRVTLYDTMIHLATEETAWGIAKAALDINGSLPGRVTFESTNRSVNFPLSFNTEHDELRLKLQHLLQLPGTTFVHKLRPSKTRKTRLTGRQDFSYSLRPLPGNIFLLAGGRVYNYPQTLKAVYRRILEEEE